MAELILTLRVDAESGTAEIIGWGDTYADEMERAEKNTGRVADATAKLARTAGVALGAVAAAIVLVGKNSIEAGIEFESSFAGVRKTVEATELQFAALAQGLRDLSKEIPVNVNELNRIAEAAGQLGISTEGILRFTETMAQLGVTTNLSSSEAATSLARFSNIVGTSEEDIDRLGSTIVDLGNNLATTEAEIVEMALRLAGAGAQVGLTEAQILSLAGALSSVGVRAEAGGTAFSRVMADIADAAASGGEKLDAFAKIAGISADEFKQAFERDAGEAILIFVEGLQRVAAEGGNVFEALRSVELGNLRVRDALLRAAGAGDLLRTSMERGNVAWQENNALQIEAEQRFKTTESQVLLMKNRFRDVFIELSGALLPIFNQVVDVLSNKLVPLLANVVSAFTDLPGPVKTATVVLGGLTTALLLAGSAALFLAPNILSLIRTFQLVSGGAGLAGVAKNLAGLGGVAGETGGSIAQLGSNFLGFFTAMKQGRTATGQFTKSMTGFQKFFTGSGSISASFGVLKTAVLAIPGAFAGAASSVLSFGSSLASGVLGVIAMANPISLIVIAVGALAGAIALFISREGGLLEEFFADGAGSIAEYRGEWEKLGTSLEDRRVSMDFLGKAAIALDQAIRDGVPGAQAAREELRELTTGSFIAEEALASLAAATNEDSDASRVLRGVLVEVSAEMNTAGRAAAELERQRVALAASAEAEAEAEKKLAEALKALGFDSEAAITKLDQLQLAIDNNALPADVLATTILQLGEEYKDLAAVSPEVAAKLATVTAAMDPQAIAAAKLVEAMEALGFVTLDSFKQEVDQLSLAIEAGTIPPGQLAAAIQDLKDRADELDFDTAESGLDALEEGFQKTVLGAEGVIGVLPKATDAMKLFAGEAGKLPEVLATDPLEIFAKTIEELGINTIPKATKSLGMVSRAIQSGIVPTSELDRVVQELDEKYKELAKESPKVAAALKLVTDAAREQGAELSKDRGIVGKFTDKLKEGVAGLTDPENLAGLIGTATDSFLSGDILGGIEQVVSEIGGMIGSAFGPIGKMIGQLAGKLVPLIAGLFSKAEFKKIGEDVGRDLGVTISDELAKTIAEQSKETGNRVGAIVANLPAIIAEAGIENDKALSTFVARARINLNELDRGAISSTVAFGQLGESLALLIPEIGKVGASTSTVSEIFEVLDTALGQVRNGLATTDDAAKLLESTFPALAQEMVDFGAAGIAGLRGIILQTRELGIEVQSVTAFVLGQTKQISGGVALVLSSLRARIDQLPEDLNFKAAFDTAKKAFKNAGTASGAALAAGVVDGVADPALASAILGIGTQAQFAAGAIATVFSELLAQGVPITQIVQSISGDIKELGDIFKELGIKAPDSFKKISQFARKIARDDVAPVIEGIQGMGQALDGLRGLGLLTQQDFASFSTSMVAGFDQLTASGLTSNEAFAAIKPQLQSLIDLQSEFGFEVDAGTQALIDQAVQQGVVKTATLNTTDSIQAGFQGLFDRFDAMLAKQGIATDGMFNFGTQASSAMAVVDGAVSTSADNLATEFSVASTSASASLMEVTATNATELAQQTADRDAELANQVAANQASTSQMTMDSSLSFAQVKLDAQTTSLSMATTMGSGIQFITGELNALGNAGGAAFGSIGDAADFAATAAEDRFALMRERLVGASIITDTVETANEQISTIGDAAHAAASEMESAFSNTSISGSISADLARVRKELETATGEQRAFLDRRLDVLEGTSSSARGGPDSEADRRRRRGGGDSFPIPDSEGDRRRRRGGGGGGGGRGGNTFNITVNVGDGTPREIGEEIGEVLREEFERRGIIREC